MDFPRVFESEHVKHFDFVNNVPTLCEELSTESLDFMPAPRAENGSIANTHYDFPIDIRSLAREKSDVSRAPHDDEGRSNCYFKNIRVLT